MISIIFSRRTFAFSHFLPFRTFAFCETYLYIRILTRLDWDYLSTFGADWDLGVELVLLRTVVVCILSVVLTDALILLEKHRPGWLYRR